MPLFPKPPRERVAVGVATTTAGFVLSYVTGVPILAFGGGGLVGFGVTLAAFNLLRLRREAKLARPRDFGN